MIDVRCDSKGLYVNEISYKSYDDLKADLFMINLEVMTIYGIDNPNREEDRVLKFILDMQDTLTHLENSIKTHNTALYKEYKANRDEIKHIRRDDKNGKQDNNI